MSRVCAGGAAAVCSPSRLGRVRRWGVLLCVVCLGVGGCSSLPRQDGSSRNGGSSGGTGGNVGVLSGVSQGDASDAAIYAVGLVGTPYRYGANTPASGFDCSGLIGHVYKTRTGLNLPRSVAALQQWGQSVQGQELRAGDLVFFGRGAVASHAGVYVGQGRFVHAPSSGGTVRLDLLSAKYWAAQRLQYRRP